MPIINGIRYIYSDRKKILFIQSQLREWEFAIKSISARESRVIALKRYKKLVK